MPYLSKADLKTHIYQEYIDEIVRNDDSIAEEAIQAAIEMAQTYLSKYDLLQLFGNADTEPTISSAVLKRQVKDIACWNVLVLGNPNIDLALFEKINDNAMKWLRDVQKGLANPDWPYRNMEVAPVPPNGDSVASSSNQKRKYDL